MATVSAVLQRLLRAQRPVDATLPVLVYAEPGMDEGGLAALCMVELGVAPRHTTRAPAMFAAAGTATGDASGWRSVALLELRNSDLQRLAVRSEIAHLALAT